MARGDSPGNWPSLDGLRRDDHIATTGKFGEKPGDATVEIAASVRDAAQVVRKAKEHPISKGFQRAEIKDATRLIINTKRDGTHLRSLMIDSKLEEGFGVRITLREDGTICIERSGQDHWGDTGTSLVQFNEKAFGRGFNRKLISLEKPA